MLTCITSFIFYTHMVMGCRCLSGQSLGERWGTACTGHQSIRGSHKRDKQPCTLTHMPRGNFRILDSRREPTRIRGEHANTSQKGQSREPNPVPSCREAATNKEHRVLIRMLDRYVPLCCCCRNIAEQESLPFL